MNQLTLTQLKRTYRRAYERANKAYSGGTTFGLDFHTIKRGWANTLWDLLAEIDTRQHEGD